MFLYYNYGLLTNGSLKVFFLVHMGTEPIALAFIGLNIFTMSQVYLHCGLASLGQILDLNVHWRCDGEL